MRLLIICSGNNPNFNFKIHQAFIYDQIKAIEGIDPSLKIDYFFIKGKGLVGYLKNLKKLRKKIYEKNYDLIHAHFCMSGLLANLQRKIPVVTTFHGSDINKFSLRVISSLVQLLSWKTIYVSSQLWSLALLKTKKNSYVIPCGVDFDIFKPMDMIQARKNRGLSQDKFILLFSSAFDNSIKNYPLLEKAVKQIKDKEIEILELKGLSREEVMLYMNAANVCVMTSFSEGSPQFIKEALACNRPVVTTNVGDVKEVIGDLKGCFFSTYDYKDLASKISFACNYSGRINGRSKIAEMDNKIIGKKILKIYYQLQSD